MKTRNVLSLGFVWVLLLFAGVGCSSQPTPVQVTGTYPLLATVDLQWDTPMFEVASLAWNPDGDSIAIGSNRGGSLYSIQSSSLVQIRKETSVRPRFAWSSDGTRLAGSDKMLWIWDSSTGQVIFGPKEGGSYEVYGAVFWGPDERSLISTYFHWNSKTSAVEQWDIETNTLTELPISGIANPNIFAPSPDGQYVVLADYGGGLQEIRDFQSGQIIHTFTVNDGGAIWNPSGTRIATRKPNQDIVVWDTATWQVVATLPGQGITNYFAKWSPQGDYLAVGRDDGAIIWNITTGATQTVNNGVVLELEWDPQGKRLATAVDDKVYIWDITQLP